MKFSIKLIFALLLVSISFASAQEIRFTGKLINPPVATRQLGPAIFFSENIIKDIVAKEGEVIKVSHGNKTFELRAYKLFGDDSSFAFYREYADYFVFKYGEKYNLELLSISTSKLEPKAIEFSVENYPGNLDEWKGYAIGAPHGDCDNETGEIVKLLSAKYGIPSTAAYGCRLSYRGIWYDCNRPLMKEAKPSGQGVIGERLWNKGAIEKYSTFQDSVWANSNLEYGERFKLFTSFHGHDLSVTLANGKKIQRPVIEGIGTGFTKNEIRQIKKFYYNNRNNYYEDPPDLYFGNLPEDLIYEYQGIPLTFYYSGLGSRTYGTLRNELTEYVLHFETPNSMRIDPKVQPKTAQLLNDIYVFVKDSILANNTTFDIVHSDYKVPNNIGDKTILPGGDFLFGAPKGFGWASEGPQHKVNLSPFEIDIYEVTNKQFCNFLNCELKKETINVIDGMVVCKKNAEVILFKTTDAIPFSEIEFKQNKFSVVNGRDNFPVVFVTYNGANKYALSKGERLPTEAEWEYAASWDGTQKYLYGISSNKYSESKANFEDSGDPFEKATFIKTTPVGFYESESPNGCKDMSGNVWEWTSDYYHSKNHSRLMNEIAVNPTGAKTGTMKVIKGGAWNTEGSVTSTTKRLGINPNTSLINLGFRCVKVSK